MAKVSEKHLVGVIRIKRTILRAAYAVRGSTRMLAWETRKA